MKIQIKSRFSASVLFEHDCENNSMQLTVELAFKSGADLYGANLYGANLSRVDLSRANLYGVDLSGANLYGANLSRADLSGVNLSGANLSRVDLSRADLYGANLSGADLYGANLSGADLSGANLSGANLSVANLYEANLSRVDLSRADLYEANLSGADLANGEKLVGIRPIFQIGPIGSRCAYFTAYITNKGLRFDAGCQHQITRETFEERLNNLYDENEHAKEYRAALALIDVHAEIWTHKKGN